MFHGFPSTKNSKCPKNRLTKKDGRWCRPRITILTTNIWLNIVLKIMKMQLHRFNFFGQIRMLPLWLSHFKNLSSFPLIYHHIYSVGYYELVQRFYIHRILHEPQSIVHCQEYICSIGFIAKLLSVAIFELLLEVVKFHQLLSSFFIE